MDVLVKKKDGTRVTYGTIDWVGREHDCLVLRTGTFKTYYAIEDVEEWQTTTEIGAFDVY